MLKPTVTLALLLAAAVACSTQKTVTEPPPPPPIPVTISLPVTQLTFDAVFDVRMIDPVVTGASPSEVVWSSSDSAVVTVSAGLLQSRSPGTAQVTAAVDGKSASIAVTVRPYTDAAIDSAKVRYTGVQTPAEETITIWLHNAAGRGEVFFHVITRRSDAAPSDTVVGLSGVLPIAANTAYAQQLTLNAAVNGVPSTRSVRVNWRGVGQTEWHMGPQVYMR